MYNFILMEIAKDLICGPLKMSGGGLPSGLVVKNPPVDAGDTGSISGLGRSHMLRSE